MASCSYRYEDVVLPRVVDATYDVVRAGASYDGGRAAVDHAVVKLPRLLVALYPRSQYLSPHPGEVPARTEPRVLHQTTAHLLPVGILQYLDVYRATVSERQHLRAVLSRYSSSR